MPENPLDWTTTIPTVEDFYWIRRQGGDLQFLIQLTTEVLGMGEGQTQGPLRWLRNYGHQWEADLVIDLETVTALITLEFYVPTT